MPKTSEICVHYVSGCCSFAEKCHMRHPGKAEAQKFRETCASIACRFGVDCANPNCLYDHTGSGRMREAPPPARAPRDDVSSTKGGSSRIAPSISARARAASVARAVSVCDGDEIGDVSRDDRRVRWRG